MDQSRADSLDRRQFLAGVGTAAIIISGAAVIHTGEAWGLEVKNLKPETMRTLIKTARDIYPHDRLADRFYAVAMKSYDVKAGTDPQTKGPVNCSWTGLDSAVRMVFKALTDPHIPANEGCFRPMKLTTPTVTVCS